MFASATAEDFAASSSGFLPSDELGEPLPSGVPARNQATCLRTGLALGTHAVSHCAASAQTFGQIFKAVRTFLPARFDGGQHLSGRVDRFQDQGYQGRSEFPLAIAQLAQEALGLMGDLLQSRKREEAARALDGVNGAEDAGQQRRILRVLLEFDKLLIQAREVFVTLD